MTERKTAEIKFRVAPSEKARWQADAERLETPLSELIRKRMNEGGLATFVDILQGQETKECKGCAVCEGPAPEMPEYPVLLENRVNDAEALLDEDDFAVIQEDASPQEDVSTSDEVVAKEEPSALAEFIATNVVKSKPLTLEELERHSRLALEDQERIERANDGVVSKVDFPWQFRG